MKSRQHALLAAIALTTSAASALAQQTTSWRYYRTGNTGIQGDANEAIYVGADGDPWIGGYHAAFEEGGFAKLVQAENRWINVSNVDYPVIGHPNDLGVSRVCEITSDGSGHLWLGTWRGALRYDVAAGPSSLARFDDTNSTLSGGRTIDIARAPDGSMFFSCEGGSSVNGGLSRYDPVADAWTYLGTQGGRIAAQPRPGGGYFVWCSNGGSFGGAARWDSTTETWTSFPLTAGNPRELISTDSVDDLGNVWMLRSLDSFDSRLDCLRPDGTWITPPLPPLPPSPPQIAAVRAFGSGQALLVDGFRQLHRFDGTAWTNLGLVPDFSPYIDDLEIDAAGNVWACGGTGGALRRDAVSGQWQRYRVTNASQLDSFVNDLSLDPQGFVWATGNAAAGTGGIQRFDGQRWYQFNDKTYGLGGTFPFPADNAQVIAARPSSQSVAFNPTFAGIHEWDGAQFSTLQPGTSSKDMVEDSSGRLWSLNEYFSFGYFAGAVWTPVPIVGWGANLQKDPTRPATVWACADFELVRTDGVYRVAYAPADFAHFDPNIATFSTVAAAPNGIAWVGVGTGLVRIDAQAGTSTYHTSLGGIACAGASPRAVTPDGRLWFVVSDPLGVGPHGLAWWNGAQAGLFATPPDGSPQWGGFPHASVASMEQRSVTGGYELWMSCLSRGIAVLSVLDPFAPGAFCAGDGSVGVTPCPCGNTSTAGSGRGCSNSLGEGALLVANGSASLSADALVLAGSGMPNSSTLYFQGTTQVASGAGSVFGDGLRCAGGTVIRLGTKTNVGGASQYPSAGEASISVRGLVTTPGARTYQAWYRNAAAYCTSATFNLTNGWSVVWTF